MGKHNPRILNTVKKVAKRLPTENSVINSGAPNK